MICFVAEGIIADLRSVVEAVFLTKHLVIIGRVETDVVGRRIGIRMLTRGCQATCPIDGSLSAGSEVSLYPSDHP